MTATITAQQLANLRSTGKPVELLDVRTAIEFQEAHIDFARNMPLDQLQVDVIKKGRNRETNEALYVICRSGSRGQQACERLEGAGVNVVNVEGGTLAWEAAGLPVVRATRRVVSLERQVRIGAGSLVTAGVLLGASLHPAFYAISAIVGIGLVFSGVTDWCGMAMLLAKMPWNRLRSSQDSVTCSAH